MSTTDRRAFPVRLDQVVRADAEKAVSKAKATAKKAPAGCSFNQVATDFALRSGSISMGRRRTRSTRIVP